MLALSAGSIIFPVSEARLTSLLALAAFVALAFVQDRPLPLLACLAWIFGFEFCFEVARLTIGNGDVLGPPHIVWELGMGLVIVPLAWRAGARPNLPLLGAALIVFCVWMLTGFHVNEHSMVGFDPTAEVLNELSKLLWAAAYFLPLVRYAPERATVGVAQGQS